MFREGTTHVSVNGKIMLARSTTYGLTWAAKTAIATPAAAHDFRDPGICRLAVGPNAGRIVVSYMDDDGTSEVGLFTMYSDDGAATWSSPVGPIRPYTGADSGGSTSSIIQLSTGECLWAVYGDNIGEPDEGPGVLRSTDYCATWSAVIPVYANDATYSEMTPVEMANGNIRAILRRDSPSAQPGISTSTDKGVTWSAVTNIGFIANAGKMMVKRSAETGTYYLWYRRAADNASVWRYSTDEMVTWSAEQLYDTNVSEYAGAVVLQGDQVGFPVAWDNGVNRSDLHYVSLSR